MPATGSLCRPHPAPAGAAPAGRGRQGAVPAPIPGQGGLAEAARGREAFSASRLSRASVKMPGGENALSCPGSWEMGRRFPGVDAPSSSGRHRALGASSDAGCGAAGLLANIARTKGSVAGGEAAGPAGEATNATWSPIRRPWVGALRPEPSAGAGLAGQRDGSPHPGDFRQIRAMASAVARNHSE